MVSFSEAQQLVIEQARSFGKEKVNLDEALGRVIAETIVADRDYPPFNRAAMDGYAIRHADWNSGLRSFTIRETIFAGNMSEIQLTKGECYKIMTGASVPQSADSIIRREDVVEHPGRIECLLSEMSIYQHISRRGEDMARGESVYSSSVLCSPAIIGLLASIGKHEVLVEKLPSISIITTGDEVVNINDTVSPVQIRNTNSHVLKALLKKWNIIFQSCVHVPDQLKELERAVQSAMSSDMIIMCGGVSAGDADHVPAVLKKLGVKNIFHKVAIKPGKPIWFGKCETGAIVFALPGNPLSCLVTCKIFVERFLSYSFGLGDSPPLLLPLNGARSKKGELDEFFPVRIHGIPSRFEVVAFNGSGDITAAIHADALAIHPCMVPNLSQGTIVHGYPLW